MFASAEMKIEVGGGEPLVPSQDGISGTNWSMGKTHGERMVHLLKSANGSDVKFLVGPQKIEIKAHRIILSNHSVVFSSLFAQDEHTVNFPVDDSTPEEFQLFLEYVYAGYEVKNVSHAFPLLQLSIKYQVAELQLQSTALLKQAITDTSVVTIFEQSRKYGDTHLQEAAFEYVLRRGFRILYSPAFLELSQHNLIQILGRDDLHTFNEQQVFDAVIAWGKAEMSRQKMSDAQKCLRSVLEDMIPLIRFPLMGKSDFSLKVYPSQILTPDELMSMVFYFSVDEEERSDIPRGIFNATPRVPYVPEGKEYIVERLQYSPHAVSVDLTNKACAGYAYIPSNKHIHSIRFKVSHPIWITSIGLTGREDEDQDYRAKFEIYDVKKDTYLSSCIHSMEEIMELEKEEGEEDLPCVAQVSLETHVLILPGKWYSASFQIISGIFNGSVYTSDVDSVVVKTDEGMEVKFEFANDEPMTSPCYTGVKQGYIPTLGFKIE